MTILSRALLAWAVMALVASATFAQAIGTSKLVFFADNATFGSSSSGCVATNDTDGERIIQCTPGANADFFIGGMAPAAADMSTPLSWSFKIHGSTPAGVTGTCSWQAKVLVEDQFTGGGFCVPTQTPSWTTWLTPPGVATLTTSVAQQRYVSPLSTTFQPMQCTLAGSGGNNGSGSCTDAATCAVQPIIVEFMNPLGGSASSCVFRLAEMNTK